MAHVSYVASREPDLEPVAVFWYVRCVDVVNLWCGDFSSFLLETSNWNSQRLFHGKVRSHTPWRVFNWLARGSACQTTSAAKAVRIYFIFTRVATVKSNKHKFWAAFRYFFSSSFFSSLFARALRSTLGKMKKKIDANDDDDDYDA